MKGFGKFITFVGVTGAALAGLWYFCETNKDKCACSCDGDDEGSDTKKGNNERSYVSLDPELKEEVAEEIKDVSGKIEKAAKEAAKAASSLADRDINPLAPICIGMDYNANINWIVWYMVT